MLGGESVLADLISEAKVKEAVLLLGEQRRLTLQLGTLGAGLGLLVARLRGEHRAEPLPHRIVLNPDRVEDRHELAVEFLLAQANAGVALGGVPAAAVVDVAAFTGFGLLGDLLAGDDLAAVTAGHEAAGEGHLVGVVDMPADEGLHAVPGRPVHERLVVAGVPVALEGNLAQVRAIQEDVVQLAPRESRGLRSILNVLGVEAIAEGVHRQGLVGVQPEDAADHGRGGGVGLGDAAAVLADIAIAVGCLADEPALLHTAGETLTDIERLLLGVKARHVGERAAHHAAGGVRVCWLRNGDEREAVLALQAFKLDIVEQVACRSIDLVEEQPVEFDGVLLRVGDQLAECFAFIGLARSLGDAEKLHDLAAGCLGVPLERILLDGERESLPLLLPAADPCQRDVPLHGSPPCQRVEQTARVAEDCNRVLDRERLVVVRLPDLLRQFDEFRGDPGGRATRQLTDRWGLIVAPRPSCRAVFRIGLVRWSHRSKRD